MKKTFFTILKIIVALYILLCIVVFFFQEKLIFFPEKLNKEYRFSFDQKFEEINIKTKDGDTLNGLLFKEDTSKGLIFYLHGNAGSLSSWGNVAKTYTELNYDVFILDYRGYGKSQGSISGQDQFYEDLQIVYDELKTKYDESTIIVLGYSIGTGPAAKIASVNHPKLLILQAPYYSLTDMMKHSYPALPTFLLKYEFGTNEYIKECKMPVVIFHGNRDEIIYYGSSEKLKAHFKEGDTLIILEGQTHNGMTENAAYKAAMKKILDEK